MRKLRAAQKLSGTMMVHARRQSQGFSPAPSMSGLEAGGGFTPGAFSLGGTPGPFSLDTGSGSEDEDLAVEEQAHMCVLWLLYKETCFFDVAYNLVQGSGLDGAAQK